MIDAQSGIYTGSIGYVYEFMACTVHGSVKTVGRRNRRKATQQFLSVNESIKQLYIVVAI